MFVDGLLHFCEEPSERFRSVRSGFDKSADAGGDSSGDLSYVVSPRRPVGAVPTDFDQRRGDFRFKGESHLRNGGSVQLPIRAVLVIVLVVAVVAYDVYGRFAAFVRGVDPHVHPFVVGT